MWNWDLLSHQIMILWSQILLVLIKLHTSEERSFRMVDNASTIDQDFAEPED